MDSLKLAFYLLVALVPSLVLHEYGHALAADRLGDPSPRRWGRLTLNPRPLIDPFGTIILPALALILVAAEAGFVIPVFAYAKPMPLDPRSLRNPRRDSLIVVFAGLGANLALAVLAGIVLRFGLSGDAYVFVYAWLLVNVYMFVIQLAPIPGLDGSKLLARVLSPRVREIYQGLDQYLVLFMLAIFFLLGGPFLGIVNGLFRAVCTVVAGAENC